MKRGDGMSANGNNRKTRVVLEQLETRTNPSGLLPSGLDGLFSHVDDAVVSSLRGDESGVEHESLRVGNRFVSNPTPEVAALLGIPEGQPVWLVSEQSPLVPRPDGEEDHGPGHENGHGDDRDGDGWAVDDIAPALTAGTVKLDLNAFQFTAAPGSTGNGSMFLYTTPDQVWFNTTDGASGAQDSITVNLADPAGLDNLNWLFTEAGTYDLNLTAQVEYSLNGQTRSFTDNFNLTVKVGSVKLDSCLVGSVGRGGAPAVTILDPTTKSALETFYAYDTQYLGGVTTTVGDVTGDGVADIITAPATGGVAAHVTVRDGVTREVLASFYAYAEDFKGRVVLASGDVDNDGMEDVIVGVAAQGAPHIVIFSGAQLSQGRVEVLTSYYAYDPQFMGGVRLDAGDTDGDGIAEVVVGSGLGATPHVTTWDLDGSTPVVAASYYAYAPEFKGGIYVNCGDIDNDGDDDVVTGSGVGAAPTVVAFDGRSHRVLKSFYAYGNYPFQADSSHDGIEVASVRDDVTGKTEIVVSPVSGRHSVFDHDHDGSADYHEDSDRDGVEDWDDDSDDRDDRDHDGYDDDDDDRDGYDDHDRDHDGYDDDNGRYTGVKPVNLPAWWNGSGVVQIDPDTLFIDYEYDMFPGYRGDVNISGLDD
jgi:hypothetical protein